MKVAVATSDGTQVSPHFGRSAGFVVFTLEGSVLTSRELRANRHTPHAMGQCIGDHQHGHQDHDHSGIAALLRDCETVICGGIGAGAAQALKQIRVRALVLQEPCSADSALQKYLSGAINHTDDRTCACHS